MSPLKVCAGSVYANRDQWDSVNVVQLYNCVERPSFMTSMPGASGARHILNTKPHPRVLVRISDAELLARWQFLFQHDAQGTYRRIDRFEEVDASEWDAVVTDSPLARRMYSSGGGARSGPYDERAVPENLFVFFILESSNYSGLDQDLFPDVAGNHRSIKLITSVAGSQLRASGENLSEDLADLVKDFVPVAEAREYQFGITLHAGEGASSTPPLRTFLLGPTDISLMGSYQRADGAGVWVVPSDVSDFSPWWEQALRDWHSIDAERFPGFPGWIEKDEWRSHAETEIIAAIQSEGVEFANFVDKHRARVEKLKLELQAASAADAPLKQLLTGSGLALQDAVRDVLREFGYLVRDMDAEYPERESREDFRITEPGHPNSLVIADATGVAKGAKGAKLQSLGNYVIQYLAEEGTAVIPKQWLLINRLTGREPIQRGSEIFRADVLQPFEAAGGLAIETPALFILHRALQDGAVSGEELRDLLRDRVGEFCTADALAWLASR